jgi:glycosyltransferase involved in cell wall biosynthesis
MENPARGSFIRTQVEYLKRAGIDIEVFVVKKRSRKLMYPVAALELRKRLTDPTIDIVHAHFSYVGMIARLQWKVPVVVSYCGDDVLGTVGPDGHLTFFSRVAAFAGRILGNYADAVIVKSQQMARGLSRKNVHVIPNEVDMETFQPVEKEHARAILGLDAGKKYLLFAANPKIAVKRFPLAQRIAEQLKQRDPSVELLVVYKEPQERLALFMNACDALIFPSYQEGSPNIVKQSMACNLPIIATNVGDVPEIIGNTDGCYICRPDVNEFVGRLSELLAHPKRTQGRSRVQHLTGPMVARQVIDVYEQVLRKRRSQAPYRTRTNWFFASK